MTFVTEDAAPAAGGHLERWRRFCRSRWSDRDLEASLDVSRVRVPRVSQGDKLALIAQIAGG